MKNILFTSNIPFHPYRGGVERVTDILCKEFLKTGKYNVYYLNCCWHDKARKNYNYPAPVTILPSTNIDDPQNIKFYHNFLKENDIDIIINQEGLFGTSKLFLNTGNERIKTISVIHNNPLLEYDHLWCSINILKNETNTEKIKRFARCILYPKIKLQLKTQLDNQYRYLCNHTNKIVVLSESYRSRLGKFYPDSIPLTVTIPNPNTYPDIHDIPKKTKEIIAVSRMTTVKNVRDMVLIWKVLYNKYTGWRLSIIGDGTELDKLKNLSSKLKLANISFYGFANPEPFYKRGSIICMTSRFEGFPMVLTEGMQYGCVPIAFDSFDALHDVIISSETGETVKPFNRKEYRKKLERLISDEDYRNRLSRNAFNYVKKFDIAYIIRLWTDLFTELL